MSIFSIAFYDRCVIVKPEVAKQSLYVIAPLYLEQVFGAGMIFSFWKWMLPVTRNSMAVGMTKWQDDILCFSIRS